MLFPQTREQKKSFFVFDKGPTPKTFFNKVAKQSNKCLNTQKYIFKNFYHKTSPVTTTSTNKSFQGKNSSFPTAEP